MTSSASRGTVSRASPLEQIAADFGVQPMTCLSKWLHQADDRDGDQARRPDQRERRELRSWTRIRLLEQENEVLRRAAAYLSQANLPGKGSTRS